MQVFVATEDNLKVNNKSKEKTVGRLSEKSPDFLIPRIDDKTKEEDEKDKDETKVINKS